MSGTQPEIHYKICYSNEIILLLRQSNLASFCIPHVHMVEREARNDFGVERVIRNIHFTLLPLRQAGGNIME